MQDPSAENESLQRLEKSDAVGGGGCSPQVQGSEKETRCCMQETEGNAAATVKLRKQSGRSRGGGGMRLHPALQSAVRRGPAAGLAIYST